MRASATDLLRVGDSSFGTTIVTPDNRVDLTWSLPNTLGDMAMDAVGILDAFGTESAVQAFTTSGVFKGMRDSVELLRRGDCFTCMAAHFVWGARAR